MNIFAARGAETLFSIGVNHKNDRRGSGLVPKDSLLKMNMRINEEIFCVLHIFVTRGLSRSRSV